MARRIEFDAGDFWNAVRRRGEVALQSGDLIPIAIAPDSFRDQGDAHDLEHVLRVVVGTESDGAACRPQGGDRRADATVSCHRRLVRDDGAGATQ